MENEQDGSEVLETTEETVEETAQEQDTQEEELTSEQIAELKAKAARADELEEKNKRLFERAKKQQVKQDGLSPKDTLYLAKTNIHEDDVDELVELSMKMGWDIRKAHEFMAPTLKERNEERTSAKATATGKVRPGVNDVPDTTVLNKASKGNVPEDDEGMQRLIDAELNQKARK